MVRSISQYEFFFICFLIDLEIIISFVGNDTIHISEDIGLYPFQLKASGFYARAFTVRVGCFEVDSDNTATGKISMLHFFILAMINHENMNRVLAVLIVFQQQSTLLKNQLHVLFDSQKLCFP